MKKVLIILLTSSILSSLPFTSYSQEIPDVPRSLFFKLSPTQLFGFRLPIIVEKGYWGRFSTELGVGPTLGKQYFGFLRQIFKEGTTDDGVNSAYSSVDKRKVGVHIQAQERLYFKKNDFSRHFIGLFYRYGYFNTITAGENTYLSKQQFYFMYGFKNSDKPVFIEYYFAVGYGKIKERFHTVSEITNIGNAQTKSYDPLPTLAIGLNIGLN